MRITIDTELDSLDGALAAVRAAYGHRSVDGPTSNRCDDADRASTGAAGAALPGNWARSTLRDLAEQLQGGDAEVALRYIAERAPAVPLIEVFAHMARHLERETFAGYDMGGRMSAVGAARKRVAELTGQRLEALYVTDYRTRQYRMDPVLAAVLLEEMNAAADGAAAVRTPV